MRRFLVLLVGLTMVNCGGRGSPTGPSPSADGEWITAQDSGFTYRYVAADQSVADRVKVIVPSSERNVTAFIGLPFVSSLEVIVYPSRAQFLAKMFEVWNLPPGTAVECGAVGTAGRNGIYMLSPRVWRTDACGLPDTNELLTGAVAHELVHALHIQQQRAQLPNETLFSTPRWVIEGLAVYASGQIDREFAGPVRSRIAAGPLPQTFADLNNDAAFFGLAGSLVGYVDAKYGRAILRALIIARTNTEALAALGTTEEALMTSWRESVH